MTQSGFPMASHGFVVGLDIRMGGGKRCERAIRFLRWRDEFELISFAFVRRSNASDDGAQRRR